MNDLHCIRLSSLDELRAEAPAWDDLWWRSDVAIPVARAELVAQWVERFHPHSQFRALVVATRGRWIAALPLVSCRVGWLIPTGALPSNAWLPCGELLLDPAADVDGAMDLLLAAAGGLPWQMLWLNDAVPEAPRWQALLRACSRAGISAAYHERFRVGRVAIEGDWDVYEKRLPKNHRQGMRRALRRLEGEGNVQFEMLGHVGEHDVKPWLQEALGLEDGSWKGSAGSSVLRTPGMVEFFTCHAEQLARWNQLQLSALRLDGRMLAFVYGFRAKGTCFAHKIGYDDRFAAFSPGHLLFNHILAQLHRDGETQVLDFMGPLNQSLKRWRPGTYGIGRIVIAQHKLLARAAMYAYEHCWRPIRHRKVAAAVAARGSCPAGLEADAAPV